jgi:uncharacterized membrane protein HdeD (DUF308 family)
VHPYRTQVDPPSAPEAPVSSSLAEDLVLAVLLIALGAARVAVAIAHGETWTADVTLPALLGVLGVVLATRAITSRFAARARRRGSAAG